MSPAISARVRVAERIADIGREAWDGITASTGNPFLSFDFLDACETSGCATERTGWSPRHLAALDVGGAVIGVMPLYLKGHSQGEYVFDHGWAQAYERAGGAYYPKLLSAVPFTPVTGPRLLVAPGGEAETTRQALLGGALAMAETTGASSLHVTFPDDGDWTWLGQAGLLQRQDQQFWWTDRGYATFDDFLADLSSSHRKIIRRERREANAGLDVETLTGADLTEDVWDAFFGFYMDTGARKWGRPYLNRRFFTLIGERMADRIALILARRDGVPIAGALNFIGADALYGRWWGAVEHVPFLHFELSYYRAIDLAIRLGLSRVEAGAQGDHKIARGYLPHAVRSAHWIANPALRDPVHRYLDRERPAMQAEMAALDAAFSPFRKGDNP